MNFAAAAELHQQEIARLADAVIPRLEALQAMTPAAFRTVIAAMRPLRASNWLGFC